MEVNKEKETNKVIVKRRRTDETLSDDEELSKVENLQDEITNAKIVLSGKNEILRLPDIETVFYNSESDKDNTAAGTEPGNETSKSGEGRRIVELAALGKSLWCGTCKEVLSLSYLEKEFRRGLGSLLLIRCHKCLIINEVTTGKMHEVFTDRRCTRFDMNTDLPLCVLNTGITLGTINRILTFFKIPQVNSSSYKKYEEELGEEEIAAMKARRTKVGYAVEED